MRACETVGAGSDNGIWHARGNTCVNIEGETQELYKPNWKQL